MNEKQIPEVARDVHLTTDGRIPRIDAIDIVSDIRGYYNGALEGRAFYNIWKEDSTMKYRLEIGSDKVIVLSMVPKDMVSPSYINYELYEDAKSISKIEYGDTEDFLTVVGLSLPIIRCKHSPCEKCDTFIECIQSGYKETHAERTTKSLIRTFNTTKNISKLSMEEYNECSAVMSAYTRNVAIIEEGSKAGYFDKGLDQSSGRGRAPTLKNTGVLVTLDAITGPLAAIAERIGGNVWYEYQMFLFVNECSSKIRYSTESVKGWTELCDLCYEDYRRFYFDEDVEVSWGEYSEEFKITYGIYPDEYGSWDEFYVIYSGTLDKVIGRYVRRMLKEVEER